MRRFMLASFLVVPLYGAAQVRVGAEAGIYSFSGIGAPIKSGEIYGVTAHFLDAHEISLTSGILQARGASYKNDIYFRRIGANRWAEIPTTTRNDIVATELPLNLNVRMINYKDRTFTLNAFGGPCLERLRMQYHFQFDQSRFETFGYQDGDKQTFWHAGLQFGLAASYYFNRYQVYIQAKAGRSKGKLPVNSFHTDEWATYLSFGGGLRYTIKEKPVIPSLAEIRRRERGLEAKPPKKIYPHYDAFRFGVFISGSEDYLLAGGGQYYIRKSYRPLSFSPEFGVLGHIGDGLEPRTAGVMLEADGTLALRFLALFNLRLTGYSGLMLSPYIESLWNLPVVGASTGLGLTIWRLEYTIDVGAINYYQPSVMIRMGMTYILAPHKTLVPPSSFNLRKKRP